MDESLKQKYKEKTLGVLKYCISFFEKHNIDWFISCGSAIGAVRHHGMIPWDDDIDIYMTRENYNKLIALRDEMIVDGYRFIYYKDKGYHLAFGKVMDDRTTVWQQRRYPVNVGCYVDIFPLDLINSGMMSFSRKWLDFQSTYVSYRFKMSHLSWQDIKNDFVTHQTLMLRVFLRHITLIGQSPESLVNRMESMISQWSKAEGDRYVSFTELGMYMFPRKWFEEYVMMPFEDTEVRVPKYYHEYLTYMYGDYMTPPPVSERDGDGPHGKLYVNLNENVPLKKIKL